MLGRNILIPRFDSFGDVVLLLGFIRGLLDHIPEARITLLVQEGLEQLASMTSDRLIWKTVPVNPFKDQLSKDRAGTIIKALEGELYDLLLTTAFNHVWPDEVVAATVRATHRIALGEPREVSQPLRRVLSELGLEAPQQLYERYVPVEERSHETVKYQVLWQELTGEESRPGLPQIVIPDEIGEEAEVLLEKMGLTRGGFFVCAPAGVANASLKVWPEENFAAVIAELERRYRQRALIVGHVSEEGIIRRVEEGARERGANPHVWLGRNGEIPLACGLLEASSFYLGNDTGLMHMAAALRKAVIAFFGGGTWPRFVPRARAGRAFVLPLPCFYCGWDCIYDEAVCLKSLEVKFVLDELKGVIGRILRGEGDFKVIRKKPDNKLNAILLERSVECINTLEDRLAESDADRTARLRSIDELTELLSESEADRIVRLEQVEALGVKLKEVEEDRKLRGEQVDELTSLLRQSESDRKARFEQIEALDAKLKEAEEDRRLRGQQIEELTSLLNQSESDRAARFEQVEALGAKLKEAKEDRTLRGEQIVELTNLLRESESDRAARLEQIVELTSLIKESESDRAARLEQIEALGAMLKEAEEDRRLRGQQIVELTNLVHTIESDCKMKFDQIQSLTQCLRAAEDKREKLSTKLHESEANLSAQEESFRELLLLLMTDLRSSSFFYLLRRMQCFKRLEQALTEVEVKQAHD